MKRLSALLLVLVLLALQLYIPMPIQAAESRAITDIQDGVTLHCFGWSYKNIEKNMAAIAAAGYTAIQTSPIQQAKQKTSGYPFYDWWVYYQPASFSIDNSGSSALGNKAEFKSMCATAEKYGIKVIVDVVANHMGDNGGNNISPSVIADLRNDASCWHDITKNTTNYSDRYNITQYCMDGLPDLNTSNKKVQNYVLSFLKECVDAGADGFRFDGAKHIETPDDTWCASDFWPTVINGIKAYDPDVYIYGELLYTTDDGGQLTIDAYTKYMSVTDNSYSTSIREGVVGSGNAGAFNYQNHKSVSADKVVYWAESHDEYINGSKNMSTANINKTWALMAARADAMSLYFARPNSLSQSLGTASASGWANAEVAAVNKFHNAFVGQSEYVANESGIAYIERGTSGVVLVNCSGNATSVSVSAHTMAGGTYYDAITGNKFTVSGGKISGQIGATGIAVVYNVSTCAHTGHNSNGYCNACGMPVGHSYNASGICACGATLEKIYCTNSSDWEPLNLYAWSGDGDSATQYAGAWPGTAMTKVEDGLYSFALDPAAENVIFNNGSDQTEDLPIPDGMNCYDLATKTWSFYQAQPEDTDPKPSDPKPTDPSEPSEPKITEPEVSEPSEPEVTEPEITEPSEPEATEPEITEPSEPEITEPEVTDPLGPEQTEPTEPSADPEQDQNLWLYVGIGAAAVILGALAFILGRKSRAEQ